MVSGKWASEGAASAALEVSQVGARTASSTLGSTGLCHMPPRSMAGRRLYPEESQSACIWFKGDEMGPGFGRMSGFSGCAVQCGSIAMWSC